MEESYQTDDIQIMLQNPTQQIISVGLFDTLEDKRPIKVGSISITSSVYSFFHSNVLRLDKNYLLSHYVDKGGNQTATIYNFKPGVYLSELENVILDPKTDKNKLMIFGESTVWITISTAK